MGRDTFDAVLASVPNGADAGRVVGRGTHYEPDIDLSDRVHSAAPLPTKPHPNDPGFRDHTGAKFGRLKVIGLSAHNGKYSALWVVRCVCGDYELRTTRTVRRANPDSMCAVCNDLKRKREIYKTQGARPITDFFQSVMKP